MELFGIISFLQAILIFTVSVFLCWFLYMQIEFRVRRIPPGPIGVPILGYTLFLTGDKLHEDLAELNRKYGKICSITTAALRVFIVSDFDTAQELLSHPDALSRPPQIFDFVPGKGGYGGMSGEQWAEERRHANTAMKSLGHGRSTWAAIIEENVGELVTYIRSIKGQPTDISTPLSKSGMNNILALILGREFQKSVAESESELFRKANVIFTEHFQNFRLGFVYPRLLKYMIKFNIQGYARKAKIFEEVSEILRREILKRVTSEEDDFSSDFTMQYLEEIKKQNPSIEDLEPHVQCCIGNIALFFNTNETGMLSTHWILYLMAAFPEKQARVHAELDDVIGKSGIISWDERHRLPYSMACLMEMFRWVTPVPLFPPRWSSDTFEFHGCTIPKGSIILVNGWAVGRDPKYWNKPDEYMPERFLQNEEEKPLKVDGYATFSFGKRKCPGETIAMMIAFLYFTGIFQRFEVRTTSGDQPNLKLKYAGTFAPIPQTLCFIERE